MDAQFIQFYEIVTPEITPGQSYYHLCNGFCHVWKEVQPTWIEYQFGIENKLNPTSDKVYASVWYHSHLMQVVSWARQYPDIQFTVGGPAVWPTGIRQLGETSWPPNLRARKGIAEDLINKPINMLDWHLEFPYTDKTWLYSYYVNSRCDWAKCEFCSHKGQQDYDTRPFALEPLLTAPAGIVYFGTPSMRPDDLAILEKLNYEDKMYEFYIRGTEAIYNALKALKLEHADKLGFRIGVEFPSDRMLKRMKKGVTRESLLKVINLCHELGGNVRLSYMTRWGDLTQQDIDEAKEFFDGLADEGDTRTLHSFRRQITHSPTNNPIYTKSKSLIGWFNDMSPEQEALDTQWADLLQIRKNKICDTRGFMDALQTNIYLTSKCTMACPHCYYPKDGEMTVDMAYKLGDWLKELCKAEGVKSFKAHFLGGEPFLNPAPMVVLISLLKSLPGHPDGKFVVFTNGEVLTSETLNWLKFHHVRLLLNPTQHSLEWVDTKMTQIATHCGGVSLAVVADEVNLPRLPELTKLALEYRGHIRINRLYNGGTIPGYVEEFGKQMHKVFDILLESEWAMWPNFILESTYPTWEGDKNCNSCGRWLLVFDPDGSIRSCNADMSTKIGHIDTHHRMQDFTFTHRWSSKGLSACDKCEWALGGWCQGGCPFTRKLTYGHYKAPTPFCKVYKELFPRLKLLKEKWLDAQHRSIL